MKNIKEIIELLRKTSSTNDKINILRINSNNKLLKKILEYTYNPYKKYGVSEKILNTISSSRTSSKSIFELLDILSSNNINDSLREDIGAFKNANIEDWDLYEKMILKDLRCNISSKTINKVWPGLIPTSETGVDVKCMLASKFDFEKPPSGTMFITEKLDGMRVWCIIDDIGNIELYTRQGKLIEGCIQVEKAVSELGLNNIILDGELLATECNYKDVYKETIKRARNKNEVKTGLALHIFDIITMEEYQNKTGTRRYSERRRVLDNIPENDFVKVVPVLYQGNDMDEILNLLDNYRVKGAEGLMCNIDKVYEFKRSKGCLKLKVMQTMDLEIIGFQQGTGKYIDKLGALVVDFKGNSVGIGTGFNDIDRQYIWDNRDKLLGRVVELRYFEVTKDKNGIESLRFPSFVCIREEGKEVSYN